MKLWIQDSLIVSGLFFLFFCLEGKEKMVLFVIELSISRGRAKNDMLIKEVTKSMTPDGIEWQKRIQVVNLD